ncbi:MAG: hypothetical protein DME26_18290 [Verrucomicrobia bacterium]|nr:MAG: hypothetical protein DME26_18290 [Verrucomicrobiota bacterium]
MQHAWVSLTAALSPRERENRRQRVGKSETRGIVERPDVLLPLPKGEGRGEGERGVPIIQRVRLDPGGFKPFILSSFRLCRR